MTRESYDYIIIGAGIYGMYAAQFLGLKGLKIALIEMDNEPLQRASYINQARVHNGYHYPRSVSTAGKSAHYYERFNTEFGFAIHSDFKKIYAIAKNDSLTNAEQFLRFCDYVGIPANEINTSNYFQRNMVEAAFETKEYTYDAVKIKEWFLEKLGNFHNVHAYFGSTIKQAEVSDHYIFTLENGMKLSTARVLNATYASVNQLLAMFGYESFKTKYELCEVILTKASEKLQGIGITLMDGPFFSVMPFGMSGYHSLTSVSYTPHETSTGIFPKFPCQDNRNDCSTEFLQNCNTCDFKPSSAWIRMKQQVSNFLNPNLRFEYSKSLFAVKTILNAAELDDSRPTVIRSSSTHPSFISVLSGKFNTIYDLEDVLL